MSRLTHSCPFRSVSEYQIRDEVVNTYVITTFTLSLKWVPGSVGNRVHFFLNQLFLLFSWHRISDYEWTPAHRSGTFFT